jgi:hypothetical protein
MFYATILRKCIIENYIGITLKLKPNQIYFWNTPDLKMILEKCIAIKKFKLKCLLVFVFKDKWSISDEFESFKIKEIYCTK